MTTVLLVGLEDYQGRRLAPALEGAGYAVVVDPNERRALETLRSRMPDLVVAGPLVGVTWLERSIVLRADRGVPLIALVRQDDMGYSRLTALDSGADDCLSEPVASAELVARARAILRRHWRPGMSEPRYLADSPTNRHGAQPRDGAPKSQPRQSGVVLASDAARGRSAVVALLREAAVHANRTPRTAQGVRALARRLLRRAL